MASYLMKARKADLCQLAQELGAIVPEKCTMIDLKKLILDNEHYDEETCKSLLETIAAEREDREERDKEEKRLTREHEIKLKEIECQFNNVRSNSDTQVRIPEDGLMKYLSLVRDQLPKAPERTENWVFFFHQVETIFEVYEVPEEYWGKIILNKLAYFIKNLTNNLGVEKLSNYKSIKESILAENSLTPLQHKKNFENCHKKYNENYVQWVARAKTNLDYYLESREVKTFQDLKDLILSDKIKDSLNNNIRSHVLIREGTKWMKPVELAKDIDLFVETLPSVRNGYSNRDKVENERDDKGIGESSKKQEKKNFATEGNNLRPQNSNEKINL